MGKKKFIPNDWSTDNPSQSSNPLPSLPSLPSPAIEHLTQKIEFSSTDIAPSYPDWRDLAFALASALGEAGRPYYHRLSRFYPTYSEKETNTQYTACLNSHGNGITIKTLYHLAKQAGINISSTVLQVPKVHKNLVNPANPKNQGSDNGDLEDLEETSKTPLPTIPATIYQNLPTFLQWATAKATTPEDKDLLLLGSIVAISPCLPNIYGIYDERTVYPNLFLFVTAQASAGKGRLTLCRKLVEPIHRALREQSKAEHDEYHRQQNEYAATKDKTDIERPKEPPLRALFIPANSSATALFQILNDNNGIGLMFETEGDTLAQTFKSEHGNYSDGFRKAFHHEKISYLRRKDREYVELETPRLSALLSGTPKQVATLIPNAENGLFSRFIFYYMNIIPVWKNVFAGSPTQTLDDYFRDLGDHFYDFHKTLQNQPTPLRFTLTPPQQDQFNAYFSQAQNQYLYLCGTDYIATIRRLALITFRITMILTTLRLMDLGETNNLHKENLLNPANLNKIKVQTLSCSDTDFQTSLTLVKTLIQHAAKVFDSLPTQPEAPKPPNQKQLFLESLPPEFSRQDYLNIAKRLNIIDKTAQKYISIFVQKDLINHFAHGKYKKSNA